MAVGGIARAAPACDSTVRLEPGVLAPLVVVRQTAGSSSNACSIPSVSWLAARPRRDLRGGDGSACAARRSRDRNAGDHLLERASAGLGRGWSARVRSCPRGRWRGPLSRTSRTRATVGEGPAVPDVVVLRTTGLVRLFTSLDRAGAPTSAPRSAWPSPKPAMRSWSRTVCRNVGGLPRSWGDSGIGRGSGRPREERSAAELVGRGEGTSAARSHGRRPVPGRGRRR